MNSKTGTKSKNRILAIILTILMVLVSGHDIHAQTGFSTTTTISGMGVNYVRIMNWNTANVTLGGSSSFKKGSFKVANGDTGDALTFTNCIYYQGAATWGTSNNSSSSDANMASRNLGTFTLRWSNNAVLPDGSKADVLMTCTPTLYLGAKPSDAPSTIYMPIIADGAFRNNGIFSSTSSQASQLTGSSGLKLSVNIQILKPGTNTPIDSAYNNMILSFNDLDVIDFTTSSGKTVAQRYSGTFSEGIGLVSGFNSPLLLGSGAVTQTVDGNTKIRGKSNDGSSNGALGGFYVGATPQSFTYIWYSSRNTGTANGKGLATTIGGSPMVTVTASAGTGGSIQKPGTTSYIVNGTTTYTYTPSLGYQVKSLKVNGTNVAFTNTGGTYTFSKLDANKTIAVEFEPILKIDYEWDGEHPNKAVPNPVRNVAPGTQYTVDTTYKQGDEVRESKNGQDGIWTFNGWDKTGTITINSDTVIKGSWSFRPLWHIDTEVENGTITPQDHDIESGEARTITYTPNEGYQLKELIVDGTQMRIKDYPNTYQFTDINEDHTIKAIFELIPELEITKESDKEHYNAGDEITYTVTIKQTIDGAEARDVYVNDYVPAALKIVEGSLTSDDAGFSVHDVNDVAYNLTFSKITDQATFTYKCTTREYVDSHDLLNVVSTGASNYPSWKQAENTVHAHIPEVTFEKKVDKTECVRDEILTYTLEAKQIHENAELRGAGITDIIPDGVTLLKDSVRVEGDDATVFTDDGSITVTVPVMKEGITLTYQVKVDSYEGNIPNTATLDGYISGEQKIPLPLERSVNTIINPPAAELAKTVNDENPVYNDEVTYTITARQTTENTYVQDLTIEDSIPDGIEVVSGSETITVDTGADAEIEIKDGKLTASIPKLKEEAVITFKGIVKAKEGEVVNKATLESPELHEKLEAEATLTVKEPVLEIEKEVNEAEPTLHDEVEYTITAKFENVVSGIIKDAIPDGLRLKEGSVELSGIDGARYEVTEQLITIYLPEIKTTGELIVKYIAEVISLGEKTNTVELTSENDTKDPRTDEEIITVSNPALKVEKSADNKAPYLHEIVSYTIKAEIKDARNAVLTDTIPDGLSLIENSIEIGGIEGAEYTYEDGIITVKFPEEKTSGTETIRFKAKTEKAGEIENTVVLDASNNALDKASASEVIEVLPPEIILTKESDKENYYLGETAHYMVKADIKGVEQGIIKDVLPEGMTLIESTVKVSGIEDLKIKAEENTITVILPSEHTSGVITLSYDAVCESEGKKVNRVKAISSNGDPVEAEREISVLKPTLSIQKKVNREEMNLNSLATYTVTAKIEGGRGVVIEDILPSGLELYNGTVEVEGIEPKSIEKESHSIRIELSEDTVTGEATIRYKALGTKKGKQVNIVTLSAANSPDEPLSDEATVNVIERKVVKTGDKGNYIFYFITFVIAIISFTGLMFADHARRKRLEKYL